MADPIISMKFDNDHPEWGTELKSLLNFRAGFTPDDIVSIEYEWSVENDSNKRIIPIQLAGSPNNVAMRPADFVAGRRNAFVNISGTFGLALGTDTDESYANYTDEEIRQSYQDMINGVDQEGKPRSDYFTEDAEGYVLLDYEHPRNLGIGNPLTFPEREEAYISFVQGFIRRIQILREFMPKIKIGAWRHYDTGQGIYIQPENDELFQMRLEQMLSLSKVEYNGQKFYDAIDWMAPVLYHQYGPGTPIGQGMLDGVRVDHLQRLEDAFTAEHGYRKEVIPVMAMTGEGGPFDNEDNYEFLVSECSKFLNRGIDTVFFWYFNADEYNGELAGENPLLTGFENQRKRLLEGINYGGIV